MHAFDATQIEIFKSLCEFVQRTLRYISGTLSQHICSLYLMDLLFRSLPSLRLTRKNVQRVFVCATCIGQKITDEDHFYRNERYAKIAGIPLKEMNEMERVFLNSTQFGIHIDQNKVNEYVCCVTSLLREQRAKDKDAVQLPLLLPSLWKDQTKIAFDLINGSPPNLHRSDTDMQICYQY
jgi:hypothetical protein